MLADDEVNITEIEVLANGRVCVFGTSLEVLELLNALQRGSDAAIMQRIDAISGCSNIERKVPTQAGSERSRIDYQVGKAANAEG